jgi:dsRNA-specific ribonuclease
MTTEQKQQKIREYIASKGGKWLSWPLFASRGDATMQSFVVRIDEQGRVRGEAFGPWSSIDEQMCMQKLAQELQREAEEWVGE